MKDCKQMSAAAAQVEKAAVVKIDLETYKKLQEGIRAALTKDKATTQGK